MTEHKKYVCPGGHNDGGWTCQFCAGDLFSCTSCRGFEGSLPTDCPGAPMTDEQQAAVYAGTLDYKNGQWIEP